jgi:FkbM family methyltransferase
MTTHTMTPCRLPDGETLLVVTDEADRIVSEDIRRYGVWQPAETALLQALVGPGDHVVDAGAHIGFFTMVLAKRVGPAGEVVAFEPEDRNFQLLKANCIVNGCSVAILENQALGDRNGSAQVYVASGNLGDHRLHPTPGRPCQPSSMVRLDDWGGARRFDFLKLDTQGSEASILEGAMATIKVSAERLVCLLEISPVLSLAAGYDLTALTQIIRRSGARMIRLAGGMREIDEAQLAALWEALHASGPDDANEPMLLAFSAAGIGRIRAGWDRLPIAVKQHWA